MKKYTNTIIINFTDFNVPHLFEFTDIANKFKCEIKIVVNPKGRYLNLFLTYSFNTFYKSRLLKRMLHDKILELEEQLKWRM